MTASNQATILLSRYVHDPYSFGYDKDRSVSRILPARSNPTTPMKTTLALVTSCLLIAASSAHAGPAPASSPVMAPASSDANWYYSLSGGALWLNDADFDSVNLNFDVGWGVNGAFGYQFDNGVGIGVSAGYLRGEFDSISGPRGNSVSVGGDLNMVPVMLNAGYSILLTERLSFYLGAGVGAAWSELDVNSVGRFDVNNQAAASDEWNWAWQGRAGFAYEISPAFSMNLGYRFVEVQDGLGRFGDSQGQMAELGFKVRF